jgi:hypothetical protein
VQKTQTKTDDEETLAGSTPMQRVCSHLLQDSHWIIIVSGMSDMLQTQRVLSFDRVLCSVEGVRMSGSVPLVGERLELLFEAKGS